MGVALCHLDRGSKVHVGEDAWLVANVVLVATVSLVKTEHPSSLLTIWIRDNISHLKTKEENLVEDQCIWPTCLVTRVLCSQGRPSEMGKIKSDMNQVLR